MKALVKDVEEISSDGDSDGIEFLYVKPPEDPLDLDTNDIPSKPVKETHSRKRKTKSKISYDENFTDESDNDLHLHLDSESDFERRTSKVNKRKTYKESSDASHFSSDSDIEIIKKIHKNGATIVNLSEKRPLPHSENNPVKKLKKDVSLVNQSDFRINNKTSSENEAEKDFHLKEFWEKSDLAEIFLSVKNEDMTIQTASEILGDSYSFTYQRYKEIESNEARPWDEQERNKPWFICKKHVQQYVNSSSNKPEKCSVKKDHKTSYENEKKSSSKKAYENEKKSSSKKAYENEKKSSNTSIYESKDKIISEICSLPGWKREEKVRQSGLTAGHTDVYYISPSGKRIRSFTSLVDYCNDEGIDINISKFDFGKGPSKKRNKEKKTKEMRNIKLRKIKLKKMKLRNKKLRKKLKNKSSDLNRPQSSEENRINDKLLLIRYNIKKCIKIILDDCMTSKTPLSPEIERIMMPHERNGVKEMASEAFQESQDDPVSGVEEENISRSNSPEIKAECQPESQNDPLPDSLEEEKSGSNAIEIETEKQLEPGKVQSSSSETDKPSEANQVDRESNSDSGSQSDEGSTSDREEKLQVAFSLDNFPLHEQLLFLAKDLGMRLARVKRWFMNKRIAHIDAMTPLEKDVIDKEMLNHKKRLLPYRCLACQSAYVCLKDLKSHKREHHETREEYTCSKCDKKFENITEYDEHKQNAHIKPKFTVLDIVWAKFSVYPWWPAIVCKHPNTEAYLRRNQIHVQFFDTPVSRGWVEDTNIKAFGPVGKCGIPLCSDKKWVTSVIEAQRAVMMPKFTRSKLLAATNMPEQRAAAAAKDDDDDESDWKPEGEIKSSGKLPEIEYISGSQVKKSERNNGRKSFHHSKKKRNYTTESTDSESSSSDPDYYVERMKNAIKNTKINTKFIKKIKEKEMEYEKNKVNKGKHPGFSGNSQNQNIPFNSGLQKISRRKRMILNEHFSHNHMIPYDVQDDLAKELKISKATITYYLRKFRTEIFTKVNIKERGVYSCNHCGVKYLSKPHLGIHMRLHQPGRGLKCLDCPMVFGYPSVYYHHLRFKGHDASKEVDEYLHGLSENAISVKDIISDLDYIFTDEYNKNCSKLDLDKIVEKVYELNCQPGEECQCDQDFTDSVPRYIQDMFQGMENIDDFIIVDDDDLIYMGKGYEDELIPMIIKNGAEMLAATDVPYKKFYYKFKPPKNLKLNKGPPEISSPSTFSQQNTKSQESFGPANTQTYSREAFSQAVPPNEPLLPRAPPEMISHNVHTESMLPRSSVESNLPLVNFDSPIPAVGPQTFPQAIAQFEDTIPDILNESPKAIHSNKTTPTCTSGNSRTTVPADIIKPSEVPDDVTSLILDRDTISPFQSESKSFLSERSTTTKPDSPTLLKVTPALTKPAVVPARTFFDATSKAGDFETTESVLPINSNKQTNIPDPNIPTVTLQDTNPEIVPVEPNKPILPIDTSPAPSQKHPSQVPSDNAIPIVSIETNPPPGVPTQKTCSSINNAASRESSETLMTESSTHLQHIAGNSSIPAQSHIRL